MGLIEFRVVFLDIPLIQTEYGEYPRIPRGILLVSYNIVWILIML